LQISRMSTEHKVRQLSVRALALHVRGPGFDSPHIFVSSSPFLSLQPLLPKTFWKSLSFIYTNQKLVPLVRIELTSFRLLLATVAIKYETDALPTALPRTLKKIGNTTCSIMGKIKSTL
jgi:hypothetical protein